MGKKEAKDGKTITVDELGAEKLPAELDASTDHLTLWLCWGTARLYVAVPLTRRTVKRTLYVLLSLAALIAAQLQLPGLVRIVEVAQHSAGMPGP